MVTNYEGDNIEFNNELPLLPIRELVIYPFMILPLFIGRESSIKAVDHAINNTNRIILLSSQKDIVAEYPRPSEIYELGTVAMIMRMRKLPDGRIKILVQGISKASILSYNQLEPFFMTKISKVENNSEDVDNIASNALIRTIREQLEKIIQLGKILSPDILMVLEDITDPGRIADLIASNLHLHVSEAQNILEIMDPFERLHQINDILNKELEILLMQQRIKSVAKDEMQKTQKKYFLKEQIRAIKLELANESSEELEEDVDEFTEFKNKIVSSNMPKDTEKEMLKQLKKLEKMHPDSSEASIVRNYMEWVTDIPWGISSEEQYNLEEVQKILNEDHFELTKVKERILEYIAVKSLKGKNTKGPVLCFQGPPGVGKTSLGKSIARAIGRKFVRISLGGVKDEAEIRGHRRTYIGAMPGRLVQAMKQAKTNNPLILLDEIDKISSDYKGDPSSALLEVLDPKQNIDFKDHYLNIPYDLSNVMFIATSNSIENVPHPLKDRMEIIHLSGYTQEEKLEISKRYLIPKQMEENGITKKHIEFHEEGIQNVIEYYTSEAGLRNLERNIGALCRKVATKIARGEAKKTHIVKETVLTFLGPPIYIRTQQNKENEIGVSTGLAWSENGGAVLYVEARKMKGQGLTLTESSEK